MVASQAKDGREIEEHRTRMKVPNSHHEVTRNYKRLAPGVLKRAWKWCQEDMFGRAAAAQLRVWTSVHGIRSHAALAGTG